MLLLNKALFEGQGFYRISTRNENNHVYYTINIDKFLNIDAKKPSRALVVCVDDDQLRPLVITTAKK